MFTDRTVLIVAPGAGGYAATSANMVDNAFSGPAGTSAPSAAARPAFSDERTPTIKPEPAAMAAMPLPCRVTAQKVTEDTQ